MCVRNRVLLLSPPQRLKEFFFRRESAEKVSTGVKVGGWRRGEPLPEATSNMAAIRERRFFNVCNWGGVRTFASVGKMAGVYAKFFGRMMLTNYSRKSLLPARRLCFEKAFILSRWAKSDHHFRIQHIFTSVV